MISDEAVEAAAAANYEARTGKQWSTAPNGLQAIERSWMRQTLEAAAPHMLADAWAEGHEDGFWNGRLSHGDPEALTGIEHAKATNTYRSQT